MKGTDHFKRTIQMYLEQRAEEDTLFAKKYRNPAKNIDECVTHILNHVQKSGCNGFTDYRHFHQNPQSSESFKIAVDVRFHHIHEDVVHLIVSALLLCRAFSLTYPDAVFTFLVPKLPVILPALPWGYLKAWRSLLLS